MTADSARWLHRRGTLASGGWETVVDARLPGWRHTGLLVGNLSDGPLELDELGIERIVIPLSGSVEVEIREDALSSVVQLAGRASVFGGPTDVLYLSFSSTAVLHGTGRVAVATSPTLERRPTRHVRADEIPIELRGAGASSREVRNLGTPDVLDAARLIVCEVLTPAGNWSSYPAHKHDEHVPGEESRLEEIYWFDTRSTGTVWPGSAALFTISPSEAGEIRLDARVHPGDTVLVPYGYHGPAATPPGVDLYYLNVMAGPDPDREWLITDDPSQTGIREQWAHEAVDPRLPFGKDRTL